MSIKLNIGKKTVYHREERKEREKKRKTTAPVFG